MRESLFSSDLLRMLTDSAEKSLSLHKDEVSKNAHAVSSVAMDHGAALHKVCINVWLGATHIFLSRYHPLQHILTKR